MTHQINDFRPNDNVTLSQNIQTGREILKKLCSTEKKVTPKLLDTAFKNWALPENVKTFTHEQIANGLGSLFGEIIKTDFSFSWKMVEDRHSNEPALVDEQTGSIIFPINTVWKRIEPKLISDIFFEPMWKAIKSHLETEKRS